MTQTSLVRRVRDRVRRTLKPQPTADSRVPRLRRRVDALASRVEDLEAEVLDTRSESRRLAELADVVTELLASEATRRDPEFQQILTRYARQSLGKDHRSLKNSGRPTRGAPDAGPVEDSEGGAAGNAAATNDPAR
jgi:hypothetical protein